MEMEEVFEARITSGRQAVSRSRKICDLISNFSVAASSPDRKRRVEPDPWSGVMRWSVAALSSAEILFFATSRSRFLPMVAMARSTNRCSTSHRNYLVARARENMGNAVAHGTRAKNSRLLDLHRNSFFNTSFEYEENIEVYQAPA